MSFTGTRITPGSMRGFNPSDNLTAANKLFSNISERVRGRAISKVLGETQLDSNDILGSQDTLRSNLVRAGATPMEALGLVNKAITPYTDQRAYDRGVLTSDRSYGLAGAGLSERVRHNKAMEKHQTSGGTPSYGTYEVIDPITGSTTPFFYNKKKPADAGKLKVSNAEQLDPMTGQPVGRYIDTVAVNEQPLDAPVLAQNTLPMETPVQSLDNPSGSDVGDYAQNFMALAEANPVNVGMSGDPVAGNVQGAGMLAMPKNAEAVPQSSAKVSYTKDGFPVYWVDGKAIIPFKSRGSKSVKKADGSSAMVEYNTDTGRDAYGREVGDEPKAPEQSIVDIPIGNGKTQKYTQTKANDGTITLKPYVRENEQLAIKEPTLIQKDKDFISSFGSVDNAINDTSKSIGANEDLFGPLEAWFDRKTKDNDFVNLSGVGQLFGTEDSQKAAKFDAGTSRMMAKVIKSLGANPSDRDLALLRDQVPQRSDEQAVAAAKLDGFKETYYGVQANTMNRLLRSNPSEVQGIIMDGSGKVKKGLVPGYELVRDNGIYKYIKIK